MPKIVTTPLWKHQKDALKVIKSYLEDYVPNVRKGSALMQLPTGTGKTGIIAYCAKHLHHDKVTLIVAPSEALCAQLTRKIRSEFWTTINQPPPEREFIISLLQPSILSRVVNKFVSRKGVIVCTPQTLELLHRPFRDGVGDRTPYQTLGDLISCIIFDEGHREPSPVWSQSVRRFDKPTILFSATPYRNDFSLFNIDPKFVYSFTFQTALRKGFVRKVLFKDESYNSVNEFVNKLIGYYNGAFQTDKPTNLLAPKVIIRCSSLHGVVNIAKRLISLGHSAVAIHDKLDPSKESFYFKHVPNPLLTNAIFWVHQFKLIEGIDDPNFCLLAIYDPFSNARSLVQQVGRIVRNNDFPNAQNAIVLSNISHRQNGFWDRYLQYEKIPRGNSDLRLLPQKIIATQPKFRYVDRDYRAIFDPFDKNIHLKFIYPRKSTILKYDSSNAWNGELIANNIAEEWKAIDRLVHNVICPDSTTCVVAYTAVENSPVLLENYFPELKTGFTICHLENDLLFYYDSQQVLSEQIKEITSLLEPDYLTRLFDHGSRATTMTLRNTDLSAYAPRTRSISAQSISTTAPGLVDHAYFPSVISGKVPNKHKTGIDKDAGSTLNRYLGIMTGRLSENSSRSNTYSDFINWTKIRAESIVDSSINVDGLLKRYASYVAPPADPTALHVLLDISDWIASNLYVQTDPANLPLEIPDLAFEVINKKFTLNANGIEYEVDIKYDTIKNRYLLKCDSLDEAFQLLDSTHTRRATLIQEINAKQALRVVPTNSVIGAWTIYANGHFYLPRQALSEGIDLLQLFCPIEELAHVTSEKGGQNSAPYGGLQQWAHDSVFHLLDNGGIIGGVTTKSLELQLALKDLDVVICDDMTNEVCDFLMADTINNRVVFAHAKSKYSILSASDFQEVCGQATKNLGHIIPSTNFPPPNQKNLWNGNWNGGSIGVLDKRIRKGSGSAEQLWIQVKSLIQNPTSSREVWIVYGEGFDLNSFENELKSPTPSPQAIQLYYLLLSTWAAISSTGAKFRIFCPDFT